jgi:hypothetical protein
MLVCLLSPVSRELSFLFFFNLYSYLKVSLRLQLSSPKEFSDVTPERALGDFVFCAVVLLFIVFSFLG